MDEFFSNYLKAIPLRGCKSEGKLTPCLSLLNGICVYLIGDTVTFTKRLALQDTYYGTHEAFYQCLR